MNKEIIWLRNGLSVCVFRRETKAESFFCTNRRSLGFHPQSSFRPHPGWWSGPAALHWWQEEWDEVVELKPLPDCGSLVGFLLIYSISRTEEVTSAADFYRHSRFLFKARCCCIGADVGRRAQRRMCRRNNSKVSRPDVGCCVKPGPPGQQ